MQNIFYIFFFIVFTLPAQTELEDLIEKEKTLTTSEGKIDLYNEIGKLTYRKDNKTYIKYTHKLIELAIEVKAYDIAAMHSVVYLQELHSNVKTHNVSSRYKWFLQLNKCIIK